MGEEPPIFGEVGYSKHLGVGTNELCTEEVCPVFQGIITKSLPLLLETLRYLSQSKEVRRERPPFSWPSGRLSGTADVTEETSVKGSLRGSRGARKLRKIHSAETRKIERLFSDHLNVAEKIESESGVLSLVLRDGTSYPNFI